MNDLVTRYLRPTRKNDEPISEPKGRFRLSPRYDQKVDPDMRTWVSQYDEDRVYRVRVPDDFGKVGKASGRIQNPKEVLNQLWAAMGHPGREPDVLVMVVGGLSRFGHAAVALKKDKSAPLEVCDIVRPESFENAKLVNFIALDDYLFGADGKAPGTEQGEAYWRNIDIVALWDVDESKLTDMHDFARRLDVCDELGYAHFDMTTGSIKNWLGMVTRRDENSYRNCAGFMAKLLERGGLVDGGTIFPKQLATQALRKAARENPDNVDVVQVPWIWSPVSAQKYPDVHSQRTPLHHNEEFDLADLARARIVVEKDSTHAVVQTRTKPSLEA